MTARYYSSDDDTPAPTCNLPRPADAQARDDQQKLSDLVDALTHRLGEREGECAALAARVRDLELVLATHMRAGVQA